MLLSAANLNVTIIKVDPYLNIDAGTMSPHEHGEVFVLDDGHECDLDLGNYERALNKNLTKHHSITTGVIYSKVFAAERCGHYKGKTVQLIPHMTDCIIEHIVNTASMRLTGSNQKPDVCLIEIGGPVGDIESALFLEAIRQFKTKYTHDKILVCHVAFVPQIEEEQKTKCAQHSVSLLKQAGLFPDFIIARCNTVLNDRAKQKIAIYSGLSPECIISQHNVKHFYKVISTLQQQDLTNKILKALNIPLESLSPNKSAQIKLKYMITKATDYHAKNAASADRHKIAFVIKYGGSNSTYTSVLKAMEYAGIATDVFYELVEINSELLDPSLNSSEYENEWRKLKSCSAILLPGGFGYRGTNGMIAAVKYARESMTPFFGICLGMQLVCIEAAQTFINPQCGSEEFGAMDDKRVICFLAKNENSAFNGTMRLGLNSIRIDDEDSLIYRCYNKQKLINERHRHKYVMNNAYENKLTKFGYIFPAKDKLHHHIEAVEFKNHPFFIGVQYHPEFLSRFETPSPIFVEFLKSIHKQDK